MMLVKAQHIILIVLLFVSVSCINSGNNSPEIVSVASDTTSNQNVSDRVFMYGIPSDSFDLISGHIKPNGFLSEILFKHGVSMTEIDQVIRNSKNVLDVRTIRSGKNYIIFCG